MACKEWKLLTGNHDWSRSATQFCLSPVIIYLFREAAQNPYKQISTYSTKL